MTTGSPPTEEQGRRKAGPNPTENATATAEQQVAGLDAKVPPGCDIVAMLRRRREAARRLPGGDPWPVRCRGERWSP